MVLPAAALRRRGIEGSVEGGLLPGHLRARIKVEGRPRVSLIVPTRDNVSLLKNCIESIERGTTYDNYEILIVDNDSDDPATLEYFRDLQSRFPAGREARALSAPWPPRTQSRFGRRRPGGPAR